MDESQLQQQPFTADQCYAELKVAEKKIKDCNNRILELTRTKDKSDEEKDELQFFKTQLGKLEKNKDYWQKLLNKLLEPTSDSKRRASDTSLASVNPNRKRRWELLNKILQSHEGINSKRNSTRYSAVTWDDVEEVFSTCEYQQPIKPLSDDVFNILKIYLDIVAKNLFKPVNMGKEAIRNHFIAPILVCVAHMFNGDVKIEIEEDIDGKFIRAHGHFEFTLRRGKKRLCIVEAKCDDIRNGLAQDLIGLEVASELYNLDIVYGLVTNYFEWAFVRSMNDGIEVHFDTLGAPNSVPEDLSLRKITGKIYSLLSSDDDCEMSV